MLHRVAWCIAVLIMFGELVGWTLLVLGLWWLLERLYSGPPKTVERPPETVCDFCCGQTHLRIYAESGRYATVCAWCLDELANEGATLGDPYGFVWYKVGGVYKCRNVFERSPKEVK